MLAELQSLEAAQVTTKTLQQAEARLLALSDALSQRYFLPIERPDRSSQGSLLG